MELPELKDATYRFFELTILELHNRGVLTLDLLDILARAYPSRDMDEFCSDRKLADDGKDLPDIAIALVDPVWHLENPIPARYAMEWLRGKWSTTTSGRATKNGARSPSEGGDGVRGSPASSRLPSCAAVLALVWRGCGFVQGAVLAHGGYHGFLKGVSAW